MYLLEVDKINYSQDSPNIFSVKYCNAKMFRRSTRFIRTDGNFTDWNNFPVGGFYWEEHEKLNQNYEYDYEIEY